MNYGFEIFANVIEAVIIIQFLVRYFGVRARKAGLPIIILMIAVLATTVSAFNFIEYISVAQEFVIDAVIFAMTLIFLRGRALEKLLIVQMTSIVSAVSSIMLTGLFAGWIKYDDNGYASFGVSRVVLVALAQIIYLIFTEYLLHNRIEDRQYVRNSTYLKLNVIIAATLAGHNFLTRYIYVNAVSGGINREMYVLMIALAAVDIIIYQLFVEIINNGIALLKEQMKSSAYESESREVENIQNIYDKTMKARHEMKSVLLNIRLMLKSGELKELEQFLDEELDVRLAAVKAVATGSRLVDAVLNRCVERAEETGMPLDVRVDCVLDGVNEMDMAIVLSNLIDNAFEAAEQAEDAHISVKINRKDNYINILISNTCSPDMRNFGGRLMTTKKDADLHGYGIENIKDIINRNYGLYEYTVKDGMFTTNVLMHV